MKRLLIYRNEERITETYCALQKLINVLNQYKDFISEESITTDTIKEIVIDRKGFKNKRYLKTLKEVCEEFGVNYDKAKFVKYKWLHEDLLVYNIANIRNKTWFQFIQDIPYNIQLFTVDYIQITENGISLKDTALQQIKEKFSYYTENEKQSQIVEKLKQMQNLFADLEKYGLNIKRVQSFFRWNNTLDERLIKQIM